jgi:hypothetical protein
MLDVCLSSLRRHDVGVAHTVVVLSGDDQAFEESKPVAQRYCAVCCQYDVTGARTSSGRHGRMLDAAVEHCKSEYVLTLDSDCLPIADGWMAWMMDKLESGTDVAGIVWPWIPPPPDVDRASIEWRMRRNHNWSKTQVACQLVRTDTLKKMGLKFADPDGDDTNFGLMDKVQAAGLKVEGMMPTRCALPDTKFDVEANRHVCVVYGNMVYHHGGASREITGELRLAKGLFDVARNRIFEERGAEWILSPENCHIYRMDSEEGVAQIKMDMLYQQLPDFLKTRNSLFGGGWT